jgi:hypothetical protein
MSSLEFNQVNQVFQKMADGISGRNCLHFAWDASRPADPRLYVIETGPKITLFLSIEGEGELDFELG